MASETFVPIENLREALKENFKDDFFMVREKLLDHTLSWSDLRTDELYLDAVQVLELPHCSYGDYDNSCLVERANHAVILDEYHEHVHEVIGGYGSTGLVVRMDAQIPEDLFDAIEGLLEYPLLDEDELHELEVKVEAEDWELFGRDELRGHVYDFVSEQLEDFDADDITDSWLDGEKREAIMDDNIQWEAETSHGGYYSGLQELGELLGARILEDKTSPIGIAHKQTEVLF